ncbi:hypothetical protein [Actinoplanes sp. URMC 104]|uniref:hypothetical protein n=1 Tax=Actinoplanes sp. URMC 104 TaxID=3423409 RepID=UPI003F1B8894
MTTTATRRNIPASGSAPGWTLVAAQGGYVALYLLCGWLALARAEEVTGRWQVPEYGSVDPGWAGAFAAGTILQLGPVLTGLGLFCSIMFFLIGGARGNRRLTVALLVTTAATLATLVVSLTPAPQSLGGWLLD